MFIQETYEDNEWGVIFRKNNLIAQMFERSGMTLEEVTTGDYSDLEKQQFCELMGLPLDQLAVLSFYGPERAKQVFDHHLTVDGPGWVRVVAPKPTTSAQRQLQRWMRYNPQSQPVEEINLNVLYLCFESNTARKAAKQLADMGIQILKVKVNYDQV